MDIFSQSIINICQLYSIMEDVYRMVHYQNVSSVNYLKDLNSPNEEKRTYNLKFNSDRQGLDSIAQILYKKMVRQGYIQKSRQFAVVQSKKKIQTKYDLTDKWIDDEQVFTQSQNESKSTQYQKFKALSGISIEQFYKNQSLEKSRDETQPRALHIRQFFNDPAAVVKFGEFKKKIQSNIRSDSNFREIHAKIKQDKSK